MNIPSFTIIFVIMCLLKHPAAIVHGTRQKHVSLNGKYTKSIDNYHLTVPHRLTSDGEFQSFRLPQYYKHHSNPGRRKKRSLDDPDLIHYGIHLNGKDYHLELWPNHEFMSPNLVFENRNPTEKVSDKKMWLLDEEKTCHYTGRIRGHTGSRVAVSTCDGLAGYITLDNTRYFIEPVEDHQPNRHGHHLHLVYDKHPRLERSARRRCGTSSDWESAWRKRFREKLKRGGRLDKRGSASVHRYLETLVVCDKKFMQYHKSRDVDTYVLTVMNMVADFYHDASSGNMMDVVVVRIMYLEKEEEEINLEINHVADKSLKSFCDWQQNVNPKDVDNPHHHDIAILLTRWDICSGENCGLMGLAYVAAACSKDEPCAINEDGGLLLGIVVAHEMGHVMGCSHDKEGESACAAQDPSDDSYYVMAPEVHIFTTKWSTCSRGFITALFESNLGECLNDEPTTAMYKYRNALPGAVYDGDAQCDLIFPGARICKTSSEEFCQQLLCRTSPKECMGNGEPAADGTKCGTNSWCFHGKCVEIGERPAAVHGGWGDWSEWTSCSRTCGGGVSTATRDCNNPVPQYNGRYCIGERKKYKICNPEPCPAGSPTYRAVQCSRKDKEPFEGKMVTWKPFFRKEEPCVLYCINEDNVLTALAPKVEDGTPCKAGTKDMCIGAVCRHVGCDNKLDSDAVEDVCGICNGDGTQCKVVDEIYRDVGDLGYKKIATVPAKARMIRFEELAPSENVIAVSDKSEKVWLLNGRNTEELDGEKQFGSAAGVYEHPEPGKEVLIVHGPIEDDIILFVVFYKKQNVGYRYKYAEATAELNYTPHYHWELLEWSDCSAKCGGGEQTSKYACVEDRAGKVSDSYCTGEEKPAPTSKKCNEQPCEIKWKVGKWGPCHACKGKSGVRSREVECVEQSPKVGGEDILVEDDKCPGPRPAARELCESHKTCRKRRSEGGIPDEMLKGVWMQIHRRSPKKTMSLLVTECHPVFHEKGKSGTKQKAPSTTQKGPSKTSKSSESSTSHEHVTKQHTVNVTLQNVGKIVLDTVPKDEIKLIKAPVKEIHLNISDALFESIGDDLADNVDTSNAKLATGEEARKLLKEMEEGTTEENENKSKNTMGDVSWKGED